nr:AbrB/MazE/SpoVT family DNA-binding domain-containing protein [uncultured Rhodopila sp.]
MIVTYTTTLRKVGGSVMLTLPPAILDLLQLQPGATVGLTVDGDRLVIDPKPRQRYTLAELLAASDYSEPQPAGEREWVDAPAIGRELI